MSMIGNNPFALTQQSAEQLPFEPGNSPIQSSSNTTVNPFNLDTNGIVDISFSTINNPTTIGEPMPLQQSPQGFGVGFNPTQQQAPAFNPTQQQAPAFNPTQQQAPAFNPTQQQTPAFNPQQQQAPAFNPQQQQAPAFAMNNQFNNNQVNNQQPKYVIVDFYWWINKKLMKGQQLSPNEAAIMTVGYNSSFNNLRFTFYSATNQTFTQTSIVIGNAQRLTTCNIFAEQVLELFAKKGTSQPVHAFERVIKANQSWNPNQTTITWNPNSVVIQTQAIDNNGNPGVISTFECQEEQITGLESAFNFMIDGRAWSSSLYTTQNR